MALVDVGKMTFPEARALANQVYEHSHAASEALKRFPRGPMGLTPDHVKALPEYKVAKAEADRAFQQERRFNTVYVKRFGKEIRADQAARRSGGLGSPRVRTHPLHRQAVAQIVRSARRDAKNGHCTDAERGAKAVLSMHVLSPRAASGLRAAIDRCRLQR